MYKRPMANSGLLDGANFRMVAFQNQPGDTLVGAVDLVPQSSLNIGHNMLGPSSYHGTEVL